MDFSAYTDDLEQQAISTPGVRGIVLLGSTSQAGASRRDEWSDHDFYAVLDSGAEDDLRRRLPFLPHPERIVLVAREGRDGCCVLYDDGHQLEFGAGTTAELGSAQLAAHEILVGDDETRGWAAAAAARGAAFVSESAVDAVGLALVKLLVGAGRAQRGEVLSASAFVRGYAVAFLALAVRQRKAPITQSADRFDPCRRFEADYPEIARQINDALSGSVPQVARRLLSILRRELEPGWSDFPTAAADLVSSRLSSLSD